ncbi:hypothetical protein D3C72_2094250 [compost metagenome]
MGNATRNHLSVTQNRFTGLQCTTRSDNKVFGETEVLRGFDLSAGMDHTDRNVSLINCERRKIGLLADNGE